jgi:hypothetical protein
MKFFYLFPLIPMSLQEITLEQAQEIAKQLGAASNTSSFDLARFRIEWRLRCSMGSMTPKRT